MTNPKGARYPKGKEWMKNKTPASIALEKEVAKTIGAHAEDMHLLLDKIQSALMNGKLVANDWT